MTRAGGLLLLLAWAPLPFGSVTPWARAVLIAGGFVVLALAFASERTAPVPRAARRVAAALAAIAALGAAQSLALPTALVSALSPAHAEIAAAAAEALAAPSVTRVALSLAPETSRRAALAWGLAAAALVAGAKLGRSRRARRALGAVLLAGGLLQVLVGAQAWLQQSRTIWGVAVAGPVERLRGSFVNPNHLATWLLVVAPLALALLWWQLRRLRTSHGLERWLQRLGPALLVWTLLFAGLAFTGSRAGLLAGLAGFAVQLGLAGWQGERRRVVWGISAAAALAVAYVAATAFQAGFGRLLQLATGHGARVEAMAATWELFTRFPWTGAGLGAFRAAFPLVHPVGDEGTWWHAHNDWLELAATSGVAGLACGAYGLYWLARGLAAAWRRGARSEDRAAALAAIGACVAVGLQELLEFGLTQPANSFALAVVCGAALAVPLAEVDAAPGPDAPASDES